MTKIVAELGKIKVVRPKDSTFYKNEKTGFVAVTADGYEYWDSRKNGAIAGLLCVRGSDAI